MTDEKNRQPNIEVVDIDSLVADDLNFNRGTDEGKRRLQVVIDPKSGREKTQIYFHIEYANE